MFMYVRMNSVYSNVSQAARNSPPPTPPSLSPPFLKRIETLRRSDALSYAYAATHIVDMAEGALRHAYAAGWKVFVECLSHHRSVLGRILSISLLSLTRGAAHATS